MPNTTPKPITLKQYLRDVEFEHVAAYWQYLTEPQKKTVCLAIKTRLLARQVDPVRWIRGVMKIHIFPDGWINDNGNGD